MAILCSAGGYNRAYSQTSFDEYKRQAEERFNQFKTEKQNEFEAYRTRINREFAEYMRQAWPEYQTKPAIPVPPSPEPPDPVIATPDDIPSNEPLPFSEVTPLPETQPQPVPLLPEPDPEKPSKPSVPSTPSKPSKPVAPQLSFDFYGCACNVPFDKRLKFSLSRVDENSVAEAWKQLAVDESVGLVKECINLRNSLRLSDWGYVRLIEKLSDAAFPGRKNESNLMQMFLLTQSGYKVRIGRTGNHLVVLMPCNESIYNYSYIPIGGVRYYVIDRLAGEEATHIFNREFPREQMFSLAFKNQPVLPVDAVPSRSFSSTYGEGVDVEIAINKNLMDFYNDYPLSSNWNINVTASLSDNLKSQLYPVLREAIAGKDEPEAANILLRFVQTAFKYKTDKAQFGRERALFPDETFYYPYSDCEDRAILYSALVRELLGLDAVLIYYPGHLATAVKFNATVNGDYFDIDGEKYVVCDPTYINADIGMAMPQFKSTAAEIIKI